MIRKRLRALGLGRNRDSYAAPWERSREEKGMHESTRGEVQFPFHGSDTPPMSQ